MIYRFQYEERDRCTSCLRAIAGRMDEVTAQILIDAAEYVERLFDLVKDNVTFCQFCHLKPATKLCDMPNPNPILGHPEESTCSAAMCDDCAIVYGVGHICPACVKRIKKL